MRNVDTNSVSDAVKGTFKCSDARTELLLTRLVDYIHDYAREVKLTHAEWNTLIEFLTKAGEISDPERNEFILLSDLFGLSSLVDMINRTEGGTESSLLGPFHVLGAPDLPVGGDMIGDNDGDQVVVHGVVRDGSGAPVSGAVLEVWQTAANGLYSNQDEKQPDFNFRCRQTTAADGRYAFTTVRPAPYTVPNDGPGGEFLAATGRHPWRASHLHFIITADGYKGLVTELFPEDDPYLDQDAVFGVRESLILKYVKHDDKGDLPADIAAADKLELPYYSVAFDFTLASD